jgi:hypothetical protein
MMRMTARLVLIAVTVVGLLLVMNTGPRSTIHAHATQPDLYSVTASSSAMDTRNYDSGNPLDPAPAGNTAIPLASVTAANGPMTAAHAAFVEPPGAAEAATQLNNVPVPYPTQADALCAACAKPVVRDADGQVAQDFDGGRVTAGAGRAHAEADKLAGLAQASNGRQSVGPLDQATNFYDALIYDLYNAVIYKPGSPPPPFPVPSPPCVPSQGLPLPGATGGQVCTATLPEVGVLAEAGASYARTTVTTDDTNGTVADTTANLHDVNLLDGLVSIGSIVTTVHSSSDGTVARTSVKADNTIQRVCVGGNCSFSITAQGICQAVQVCADDPVNDALRSEGFNICRLGTGSTQDGTTVTASAAGVVVEWHAKAVSGNYAPDPDYYKNFGGACAPSASTPHQGFYGISSYVILGESSGQEHTDLFPTCSVCTTVVPNLPVIEPGIPAVPPVPGSSTTTITNTVPGAATTTGPGGTKILVGTAPTGIAGLKDRRGLLLAVFGFLELILLSNLTAMALARRTS